MRRPRIARSAHPIPSVPSSPRGAAPRARPDAHWRPSRSIRSASCRARTRARARRRQIIAEELGAPVADDDVLLGVEADDLAALAERHGEDLVLVGHEPDLSVLLHAVTGARVSFPKAGAAAIEPLAGQQGELRWFLRPRALALIAGGA